MLKKMIIAAAFFTMPMISVADELQINQSAPETYIVEKGDTLWDISAIFLDQPWLWPKLWRLNPEINNPHLIYPGDVLRLVYDENGEPQLIVDVEPAPYVKPTKILSPLVRKEDKKAPVTVLPLHEIAPYIPYNQVLTEEQLESMSYVLGSDEGYKSSITGFKLYVTDNLELGKSYAIFQKGDELIDPDTEESIGFDMILAGTAQAVKNGDMDNKIPGTLFVNKSTREIRSGNYIIKLHDDQLLPSFFNMQSAAPFTKGTIIKSESNGREFGKLEVIMLNIGVQHGVKQGDIMLISRQSPGVVESSNGPEYLADTSRWNKLANDDKSEYNMPSEEIGQVIVYRVFDKASMALIMNTEKPARLLDKVIAP